LAILSGALLARMSLQPGSHHLAGLAALLAAVCLAPPACREATADGFLAAPGGVCPPGFRVRADERCYRGEGPGARDGAAPGVGDAGSGPRGSEADAPPDDAPPAPVAQPTPSSDGGLPADTSTDAPAVAPAGPRPLIALQVAAGGHHTCAVLPDGTARCWGRNTAGQLGGSGGTAVAVGGLSGVTDIAAGRAHSCAIASGLVRCWGQGDVGQLGDPTSPASMGPSAISVGHDVTCSIVGGAVWCWGLAGAPVRPDGPRVPAQIPGLTGVTQVSAVYYRICGVARGAVWCWRQGGALETIPGLTSITAVGGDGGSFSCALDSAGAVRCWGRNDVGQLGRGIINSSLTGSPTPEVVRGLSAASLAVGSRHACALTADGNVWCWGGNRHGQVGNGTLLDSPNPLRVQGLRPAKAISASGVGGLESGEHTCALVEGGEVWCWGNNVAGQLGNGTVVDSATPSRAIVP
jgi:hypothetical protein